MAKISITFHKKANRPKQRYDTLTMDEKEIQSDE